MCWCVHSLDSIHSYNFLSVSACDYVCVLKKKKRRVETTHISTFKIERQNIYQSQQYYSVRIRGNDKNEDETTAAAAATTTTQKENQVNVICCMIK